MDKIKAYMERIDALTIRERGMVLLAVLAVMIFLWDSFLMSPLDTRQQRLQAELESKRAEISGLGIQMGQLVKQQQQDPNAEARAELQTLRQELATLDEEISSTTQELVDPARMPQLLRTVINRTAGLNLTTLEGLGVTPLMTAKQEQSQDSAAGSGETFTAGYKHGMRIHFQGGYLETLEYLRKLEALEWNFFWDRIEFNVRDYPEASADIRLYTLSLTPDWIKA